MHTTAITTETLVDPWPEASAGLPHNSSNAPPGWNLLPGPVRRILGGAGVQLVQERPDAAARDADPMGRTLWERVRGETFGFGTETVERAVVEQGLLPVPLAVETIRRLLELRHQARRLRLVGDEGA